MDPIYRIQSAQTLKVEFTEAEAFATWHALSETIRGLDAKVKAQSDIVWDTNRSFAERKAAQDVREWLLAQRQALTNARVAMSDAGL